MSPDFGIMAGAAGCLASAVAIALIHRQKESIAKTELAVREEMSAHQLQCEAHIVGFRRQLDDVHAMMQASGENLKGGRLSRSARAEALQALRTGISPDTAAVQLGMARSEIRLLSKVSNLLSAYR